MNPYLIAALVASVGDFIGSGKYIRDVYKGRTKPHIFSWLVWGILMGIGLALQLAEGSWTTAISLGVGASINFTIFALGYRQGDHDITRGDWIALIAALLTIPIWLLTKNPLWAALLISGINFVGNIPTLRKAWTKPNEENLFSFSVYSAVAVLRLLSISPFTLVTALYPAVILVGCLLIALVIAVRRRVLSPCVAA